MKKAVIFGASGFIGSYLLQELLNNPGYEEVIVVVRKKLAVEHPKLKILIGDYKSLSLLRENIIADEIFIALGTTKRNTPDQREYYVVDHDYPVLAAKIARENGAKSVFLVSSVGANANATIFYVKTKGETERDILALNFEHTHIFRPSMLLGNRKENRPFEKILIKIWPAVNLVLIGKHLIKYKGIDGKDVARAINNAAGNQTRKVAMYYWEDMKSLL